MEMPLTIEEQQKLLAWVKQIVTTAVTGVAEWQPPAAALTPGLLAPAAVFVTLWKEGELRGCIGQMDFERALWENAMQAATASALHDPRFAAVTPVELPALTYDISILAPPVPIASWAEFDVTRHGIIVEQDLRSALLLPKVARDHGWSAEQTLDAVCHKAGLSPGAWRSASTRLKVFEASEFSG